MEEKYEPIELNLRNFEVVRLVKDRKTEELLAVKYIERGETINEKVLREIINHSSLRHPNIVCFNEILLTPTHLAIVMEYAARGELYKRIRSVGRFNEDEARFYFQQLISGVSYCHSMKICHRDLKLENTLLGGTPTPCLKLGLLHSQPVYMVRMPPGYMAPEVLSRKEYDGKIADVWSCGVTLYVMLVGSYPFEDPDDSRNFREAVRRILSIQYPIPDHVRISVECRELLSKIFVADPSQRITIPEIKKHPWFLKNLPEEMGDSNELYRESKKQSQTVEEIMKIVQEAKTPALSTNME